MNSVAYTVLMPSWFWLLPALLLCEAVLHRYATRQEDTGLSNPRTHTGILVLHPLLLKFSQRYTKQNAGGNVNRLVHWLVLLCLVTALAQPVRIGTRLPDPPRERDIVFLVDASASMLLRDYEYEGRRIDRMNLVLALLDRFVSELNGERISIITFADQAHTLVPLTRDDELVRAMLKKVSIGIAGRSSAVGDAIALAVRQARRDSNRKQAFVLFSDAALPTGMLTPGQGAMLAADAGIPLYTVAIGAASYSAAEQQAGGLIYHPANLDLLRSLAETTGAQSYQAGNSEALAAAITAIDQRERNPVTTQARYVRQPLYLWPLLSGLLIFTLYQLAGLRGGRRN